MPQRVLIRKASKRMRRRILPPQDIDGQLIGLVVRNSQGFRLYAHRAAPELWVLKAQAALRAEDRFGFGDVLQTLPNLDSELEEFVRLDSTPYEMGGDLAFDALSRHWLWLRRKF